MSAYALVLRAATHGERIEGVTSFVGEDASGAFGILPRRRTLVTVLAWGLCRFRCDAGPWRWLALPGGVLRFGGDVLAIHTRFYVLGGDPEDLIARLNAETAAEEADLGRVRALVRRMDQELLRALIEADER